jgi:hypothetical protein
MVPVTLILIAAVASGLTLGLRYLRDRRKPVLVGFHLLLGAGGLEQLVILLPPSAGTRAGSFGLAAAACLATALALGFVGAMLDRRSRQVANIMVSIHAGVGFTGFALFLAWLVLVAT